jgi:hypothetical protein
MSDLSRELAREEFAALRATIRERGSLRLVLFVATLGIWGALLVATNAVISLPVACLVPLLALAGGFEAVASLHIGVERVGRYVQVRYEGDAGAAARERTGPSWEQTAMAWGLRFPASGIDPLFATIFLAGTVLNFASVAWTAVAAELITLGILHALFVARVIRVRAWAARQRTEDLDRFRGLVS